MTMRVSLAADRRPPPDAPRAMIGPAAPMLAETPAVIVGSRLRGDGLAEPIRPTQASLFGPRGAALSAADGALIVADTGHHRLLIWPERPRRDFAEAAVVIGQPDFASEGRNGKGAAGAATLNIPTGVAVSEGMLAVADAWNHRVLIWRTIPERSNQPADLVLGQSDFTGIAANRGGAPGADTLNWCYGVAFIDGRLAVADTGNRRVLVWNSIPDGNGAPADRVIGQAAFDCRDENAGADAGGLGMRWPHGIVASAGRLLVADAGNNRIMVWNALPETPGVACDIVLGQKDQASLEHNRARYLPDAAALNMPYGLALAEDWIIAADTANSRLVGWNGERLAQGAAATGLAGQPDFCAKGDNRWGPVERDSLCWPYGVTAAATTIVVADSGNNRVLLWELAR